MASTNPYKQRRRALWVQFAAVLGILLGLNLAADQFYTRLDLTADHRYTLSEKTVELLDSLDGQAVVTVYLEGDDLPPGFQQLRTTIKDLLDEMRAEAGRSKIEYQFIDPSDVGSTRQRDELYQQLSSKGLSGVNLQVNKEDGTAQRIIFPGAVVSYNGQEKGVQLLQQQLGNIGPEQVLLNSQMGAEFALVNAINVLGKNDKPLVAILQGHGELMPNELADFGEMLSQSYQVDIVDLPRYKVGRLDPYKLVVIAGPDSFFTELEKYKIDQYLMGGGHLLWLMDGLHASHDSLKGGKFFTTDRELNLDDYLFKHGVRLNYNLVQDYICGYVPIFIPGRNGAPGRKDVGKWPWYPVAAPTSPHPIVNNLNPIWFQYASTLDTVGSSTSSGVEKTILLTTSPYTRVFNNPVEVNFDLVARIDRELYNQGPKNLAVLLEGTFRSPFENRLPPSVLNSGEYGEFKAVSAPAKMIVVSDADIARSAILPNGQPVPLGYDRYTQQTFGNREFLQNCADYLGDDAGLLSLRSKQFQLRLLNKDGIEKEKGSWQFVNVGLPLLMLGAFGFGYNYVRRRKYAS